MSNSGAGARDNLSISFVGGEMPKLAAGELADGLSAMLGVRLDAAREGSLESPEIRIHVGDAATPLPDAPRTALDGDSFELSRTAGALTLRAGSERGLLHGSIDVLERLGARFFPGVAPQYPRIDAARIRSLEPYCVTPAFRRRAFISDIMTWNYTMADRLAMHLRHDREFIPWMARRGINAFSYIRHAHDTRLKIDEISPLLRSYGIGAEYGGHVLQILLPRERFSSDPDLFPVGDDGARTARGNLCVSNQRGLSTVRDGAIEYVRAHPENELLHIWGADVRSGAWCRCGSCRELAPQLQYLGVVNAIARELAADAGAPPVAYLAYHDTIDPHPGLRPLKNVWVEWAPRERCYSHAIDDTACEINPRYLESLKRYLEIFDGRAHVFEYYADAILFGGLGFATPGIVASDLRAYRALGVTSVSCLTFGAYSVMSYPANLEAFVRGSRDIGFEPAASLADVARGRHPACASEMAQAYRAVERASRLALDYADVMHPVMDAAKAARKRVELRSAAALFDEAIAAAGAIAASARTRLTDAERELWRYSGEALLGISNYLAARELSGTQRRAQGEAAVGQVAGAIERIRAIDPEIRGTWGAYDIEWMREIWLRALRRNLDDAPKAAEELF